QKTMTGEHGFVKAVDGQKVQKMLSDACLTVENRQLESDLNREGVPAARVRTVFGFMDEALQGDLLSLSYQQVQYQNGTATNFRNGFISNLDDEIPPLYAPALGEHTEQILSQLGFGSEELDALRKEGTVFF